MKRIAVIGGGPAGMMAALAAAENENACVCLFEKNDSPGKKLRITGKGRCNLTNASSVPAMREKIVRGNKFLLSALYAFDSRALCDFFTERGVALKTERGGRVFPASDRAADIVEALLDALQKSPRLSLKGGALDLEPSDGAWRVKTKNGAEVFDAVILATGGLSYPRTGCTGDGWRWAQKLGHTVTPPRGALVPLLVKEPLCREAMGLSLKNCAIRVENSAGKRVYEDFGELLFCHFGLSGPIILSASSHLDFDVEKEYRLFLDLKPALDEETLDKRLLQDMEKNARRDWINSLSLLLPKKLIAPMVALSGIEPHRKVSLITRAQRRQFVHLLKNVPLTVTGTRPIEEAIVTRGGVSLSEIDPHTMASRIVPGLYFAGEMLDADALTGGYNLQIAFSTGRLAGKSAAMEE